jgi:hypothetical protein
MKKVLLLSLAIMMVASYAMADDIGVYTDQAGTNCEFVASAIAPVTVYVVHRAQNGTTGSQFKVVNTTSWSFSASVLGGFLAIGDAFTDLSLAYGGCLPGPVAAVALNGFSFPFPGDPCMQLSVVAAPNKVGVISVDCNFAELPATGGKLVINANATCPCVEPNATEPSTWGKVKSLYR